MTIAEKEEIKAWVEQSLIRAEHRDKLQAENDLKTEQSPTNKRGWFSSVIDYLTGAK